MKVSGESKQENVKFSDQLDPYMYEVKSVMDPTRKLQDSNDATLQNFFQRPIKIAEEEWSTSTVLAFDISPWESYFSNPRVQNRIANFNLLRAKLHIKVVINGNGFHYGRALVSYLPFDVWDSLSSNAAPIREDLVQASQQPHIFLDPTTSQGGEMVLPFYNYLNYSDIPSNQIWNLGGLYFRSLNALQHANGASDVVTISVFAWAEDVEMSVLTSAEPNDISPQSGRETDEVNEKGTVSGPATSLAKIAGSMTNIPTIGPFAQATETAATATAAVAKMFGYCRPTVTKNPEPYKPYPNSSLALTNVGDGAAKLTIDDKQELSIDPRIVGLDGVDPLSIKEIAKRESYLTTFSWAIGAPPETMLWNARIDPVTWAESSGTATAYHFPACAMAALPFKYWTGTMKFRFQIVCSAFHKGRVKVVYDPNYFKSNEYNTNYLSVIDIADKTDFTIEIANGQPRTLLTHARPGLDVVSDMYSTTPYSVNSDFGNGVVGMYVVNELTTPNSTVTNDVEINVFVSMGDDFEVFVPDDHFQHFVCKPQSGREEIVTESQNTAEPSAPQHKVIEDLGPTMSDNSYINKVFTGESIASFRTLLKRYYLWTTIGILSPQDRTLWGRFSMFPFLRGNVEGAVHTTNTLAPYNYCNTVLLHWVTFAFSGWRGSIRYKWLPRGQLNSDEMPTLYVQRHAIGEDQYDFNFKVSTSYLNNSQAAESTVVKLDPATFRPREGAPFSGAKGQVYQCGRLNPCIEYELPYYSPFRFSPGKRQNYTSLTFFEEGYDWYLQCDAGDASAYDIHVAAGEDFTPYFFTGLPRMYFEASPPAPQA
jgi:hypothetical protein